MRLFSEPSWIAVLRHPDAVSQFLVASQAAAEHRVRDRLVFVEVIEDQGIALVLVLSMKPPGILNQAAFERKRHRQNQSIQTRQIESLTDQRRRRKKHERGSAIIVLRDLVQHLESGLLPIVPSSR